MTAFFTASEYEALPEALYPAQVISIEKLPGEQYGDYLRWNFRLRLPDGSTVERGFNTSDSTGPKSNAYKWATVLLGHKPQPKQTEDLTGKVCQLHLIVNEDGFNRIETVIPPAAGGTSPASQAPAAQVFDDSPPRRPEQMAEEPTAALPF